MVEHQLGHLEGRRFSGACRAESEPGQGPAPVCDDGRRGAGSFSAQLVPGRYAGDHLDREFVGPHGALVGRKGNQRVRTLANFAANLQAIQLRKHNVEQYYIVFSGKGKI